MGLDLYVGSLTRYYARDWQTIAEQRQGPPVIRPPVIAIGADPDGVADPADIQKMILLWRDQVTKALGDALPRPLEWEESISSDYFTDEPAWRGYGSLALLALYSEQSEKKPPAKAPVDWREDPLWQSTAATEFEDSAFHQILLPEIWLPVDFDFVFRTQDPTARECSFGSSYELLRELESLGRDVFSALPAEFQSWLAEPPAQNEPFATTARRALAVFTVMARKSLLYTMPMRLDY